VKVVLLNHLDRNEAEEYEHGFADKEMEMYPEMILE